MKILPAKDVAVILQSLRELVEACAVGPLTQAGSAAVIEITGYGGSLTQLAVV